MEPSIEVVHCRHDLLDVLKSVIRNLAGKRVYWGDMDPECCSRFMFLDAQKRLGAQQAAAQGQPRDAHMGLVHMWFKQVWEWWDEKNVYIHSGGCAGSGGETHIHTVITHTHIYSDGCVASPFR